MKINTKQIAVMQVLPHLNSGGLVSGAVEVAKELSDEEKCEVVFKKTNTIDKAWWENEGVTKMFGGDACRSTSTGDMVLIGTKKYKCAFIGWELI